ncbi:MAG: NAD-binding protein, partial [archaeon]|nr:NAD-binding protein [archaeon]
LAMKIIIVGAGNVGLASAKAALIGNDVHMIEKDVSVAETAKSIIPVSILKGDASNPNVLRSAIERIHPDVVLSAVKDDAINIFVCMNSKRMNPKIHTIACIRNPEFLEATGYEGVDVLISPDKISVEKMISVSRLENAVNHETLDMPGYGLTTFRIEKGHDIVGRTIMNIDLPKDCAIVSIIRGDLTITDIATTEIHVDDRIVVFGSWSAAEKFNRLIGIKKEAREFVILGAGSVGLSIAKVISDMSNKNFVKILDDDMERCREAAKQLRNAIVVKGNIVDPQFLRSESIERADALISVTDIDERNLLACMTALRLGINKIVSRYSIEEYEGVFKYAGIESVVGYHKLIINEVTKNLRTTENVSIHVMEQGDYFLNFKLDRSSPLVNEYYGDVVEPEGVNICAIIREGKTLYPDLMTRFEEGDHVLLLAHEPDNVQLTKFLGKKSPEL